jgi:hypothetical protein
MTPKLLYLKLDENNAKADFSRSEGFFLQTARGRKFSQIQYPRTQRVFEHDAPSLITKPDWVVQHALNAVCEFDRKMMQIDHDYALNFGTGHMDDKVKRKPIPPIAQPAVKAIAESAAKTIAAVNKELRNFGADTQNASLHHYKVPEFDPADMMGFFREQEIRSWINNLGETGLPKIRGALHIGSNPYVSLAILRSPIPYDALQEDAQKGWRTIRDKADPETAQKLEGANELIEWATPYVKVTANMIRTSSLDLIKTDQFVSLVPADARELFGLREAA